MEQKKYRQTDPALDVPAEANTEKHINFLKEEEEGTNGVTVNTNTSHERRKEWKEGLEEGREAEEKSKNADEK